MRTYLIDLYFIFTRKSVSKFHLDLIVFYQGRFQLIHGAFILFVRVFEFELNGSAQERGFGSSALLIFVTEIEGLEN